MKTINRTAIIIVPKQQYIDWADSFNDEAIYYKEVVTTILIPDAIALMNMMNSIVQYLSKKSINRYLKNSLNPG